MMKKRLIKISMLFFAATMLTACSSKNIETQNDLKSFSIASLKEGKYEEALSGFEEALSLAGGHVTAREIDICYYKAVTQYLLGDIPAACETLDSVIAYDEKYSEAYYLRGSIYLSEGETDKAIADYRKFVGLDVSDHERVIRVFANLNGNGQREEGLSVVSNALSSLGDADEDQLWRGRYYILLEQYDDALDYMTQASAAGFEEANVYLAQIFVKQDNAEGAKEKLSAYLFSETLTAEGLATAGEQYMVLEEYESAYDCFEKAIAMYETDDEEDKDKPDPGELSGETYRRLLADRVAACEFLGEWSDALKYARDYIASYPQDEKMLQEIKFLATR